MRLRVEIADLIDEFEYAKKEIFVGANEKSCQLFLDYEGIGDKHLKITEEEGILFAQDLMSGYDTYSNGKKVKPGTKLELQTFLPIEIGGIFIYAMEEVTSDEPGGNGLNISFGDIPKEESKGDNVEDLIIHAKESSNEPPDIDELKKELLSEDPSLNNTKKISKEDKTKKFKPEIYATNPSDTKEFKLRNRTVNTKELKIKTRTKARGQVKSAKKTRRKRKSNQMGRKVNLNSLIIVLCSFLLMAFFYYKNHYKKNLDSIVSLNKNNKLKYTLLPIENTAMKEFSDNYLTFVASKKCLQKEIKVLCNELAGEFKKNFMEGALIIKDTAFIGINLIKIDQDFEKLFKQEPKDRRKFIWLYKDKYLDIANVEKFIANGFRPTLIEYEFLKDKYEDLIYFINLLQTNSFKVPANIKKVHFFSFEVFQNEITVRNFLEMNKNVFEVLRSDKEEQLLKLRSYALAYLTRDIKSFVSYYGDSRYTKYNGEKVKNYLVSKRKVEYEKIIDKQSCDGAFERDICNKISSFRVREPYEGVVGVEKDLHLVIDVDRVQDTFKSKFSTELSSEQKQKFAIELQRNRYSREDTIKALDGSSMLEVSLFDNDKYKIYSDIILGNYSDLLKVIGGYDNLIILGVSKSSGTTKLKLSMSIKFKQLKKYLDNESLATEKELLKYFWIRNAKLNERFFLSTDEIINYDL